MIDFDFDQDTRILRLTPESALDKVDFAKLSNAIDPEIQSGGDLAGIIIDAPHFPGWDGFGALVTHLRFVREHQQHVKKIAVVTNSHLGDLAERLVSHFVSAEVRQFPGGQTQQARAWIADETTTVGSPDV
jgi:hypothetical protein